MVFLHGLAATAEINSKCCQRCRGKGLSVESRVDSSVFLSSDASRSIDANYWGSVSHISTHFARHNRAVCVCVCLFLGPNALTVLHLSNQILASNRIRRGWGRSWSWKPIRMYNSLCSFRISFLNKGVSVVKKKKRHILFQELRMFLMHYYTIKESWK